MSRCKRSRTSLNAAEIYHHPMSPETHCLVLYATIPSLSLPPNHFLHPLPTSFSIPPHHLTINPPSQTRPLPPPPFPPPPSSKHTISQKDLINPPPPTSSSSSSVSYLLAKSSFRQPTEGLTVPAESDLQSKMAKTWSGEPAVEFSAGIG